MKNLFRKIRNVFNVVTFITFIKFLKFITLKCVTFFQAFKIKNILKFIQNSIRQLADKIRNFILHPKQTWQALFLGTKSPYGDLVPRMQLKHFAKWCWATMPRRIVSSILIVLFIITPIFNILFVPKTQAAWWNDQWLYRKSIAATNNTTAQTNVYIALTLDTSDTTKFQADCGDLRFTNTAGNLQDYYLVSGCGTASTSVHVNLQTFSAGIQNIFYYYGNISAPNGFSGADFSTQASDYTVGAIAAEEKGPGPVAYWKLDEGTGTVAKDATGLNNNATLTNMSATPSPTSGWQTEDQCVAGKCLAFDGTDDRVAISTFQSISNQFSISQWLNVQTLTTNKAIFGKWGGSQNNFLLKSDDTNSNQLKICLASSLTDNCTNYAVATDANLTTSSWKNVQLVYDGTQATNASKLKLYLNGIQKTLTFTGTLPATLTTSTAALEIGGNSILATYFSGKIDEPKIYPYARTKAQVAQDYDAGLAGISANSGVMATFGDNSDKWLSDGLVGYWKMDEASWNGTAGEVKDASGKGNNGTAVSGVTTGAGKFGSGGTFTAASQIVDVGNNASLNLTNQATFSFWYKPTYASCPARYQDILGRRGTGTNYEIYQNAGTCKLGFYNGGLITSFNYIPAINTWINVVIISNASESKLYINGAYQEKVALGLGSGAVADSTKIGAVISGEYPEAVIDETRIYNRALSPAEVRKLYDWAPVPVAHWKLDENSGTLAADSSGNGNNGTLTNGPKWAPGKIGGATKFDGVNDYINIPQGVSANLNFSTYKAFTISGWVQNNNGTGAQSILGTGNPYNLNGKGFILTYGYPTAGLIGAQIGTGNTATYGNFGSSATLVANAWTHLSFVFTSTTLSLYKDGKFISSINISAQGLAPLGDAAVSIGTYAQANLGFWLGNIDDIRIYNYARTQEQILQDMGGNVASNDLQTTKEALAYYKFDEGTGTTANNLGTGGSALNGTLTNMAAPATATSGWTDNGKFGKGLSFDGSDDRVAISNFQFPISNQFSISQWLNVQTLATNKAILGKWGGSQNNFLLKSDDTNSNQLKICLASSLTDNCTNYAVTTDANLATTTWQNVQITYDGSQASNALKLKLFLNGIQKTLTFSGTIPATLTTSTATLEVGGNASLATFFAGKIDEVKIFPYALSTDDIRTEYNRGNAVNMASSGPVTAGGSSTSARAEYCPPGNVEGNCASGQNPSPVGEWKMDEGTGTTAKDTSGNNNNGTLSGSPAWTNGKFGNAVKFDGVNDCVLLGTPSSLQMGNGAVTVSSWVKLTGLTGIRQIFYGGAIGSANGYGLAFNTNSTDIRYETMGSTGGRQIYIINAGITLNQWYHIEAVFDGVNNVMQLYVNGVQKHAVSITDPGNVTGNNFVIGSYSNGSDLYFPGSIDQVRIYPYARTPAQIAYDYNRGGPVGWWKMDECQGTTINDASGNGNNGTLTVGATGSQASAGTCTAASSAWGNGANGKFSSALSFDGVDDGASISTFQFPISNQFSISQWFNVQTLATSKAILGKWGGSQNNFLLKSDDTNSNQLKICLASSLTDNCTNYAVTTDANLTMSSWKNVQLVYDGTQGSNALKLKLFLNGIQKTLTFTGTIPTTLTTSTAALEIGGNSSLATYINGKIDDVRVYNYALSEEQVYSVMNGGASLSFGSNGPCGDVTSVADADGNAYGVVKVGTQCWMDKNLNVGTMLASGATMPANNTTIEKWCYGNSTANCTADGGLYHWDEAMQYSTTEGARGICPAGWHVPTDSNWKTLEMQLGMTQAQADAAGWRGTDQGTKLKENGSSGLNFPLAGHRSLAGTFLNRASYVYFWSSSQSSSSNAWNRYLYSGYATVYRYAFSKSFGFSVRCLKN